MEGFYGNNPLTGVANVFDLGLVFMVGLLKAVFYAYRLANGSLIYVPDDTRAAT